MNVYLKIILIAVIAFIPLSILFPQVFLIAHLEKYETNQICDSMSGQWDWYTNLCNIQHIETDDYEFMCNSRGATLTCDISCYGQMEWNPWQSILPLGCLDICKSACEIDDETRYHPQTALQEIPAKFDETHSLQPSIIIDNDIYEKYPCNKYIVDTYNAKIIHYETTVTVFAPLFENESDEKEFYDKFKECGMKIIDEKE